jgi:hypothetical protein
MARAIACPESFMLPGVQEAESEHAAHGTGVHDYLKEALPGNPREALERVPEENREAYAKIDLTKLPRSGGFEVAIAWDPETDKARILGHDIQRRYAEHGADQSREVCMTLDIGGVMQGSRAVYFDFKTGWATVQARDSWQLRTGAIGLAAVAGCDEALTGHLIVHDGDVRWDLWEIDSFALAEHKARIRDLCRRLRAMEPRADLRYAQVAEGNWCRYCPAWLRCPAKIALVYAMNAAIEKRELGEFAITRENGPKVWHRLAQFDDILEKTRNQVRQLALGAPLDLGDGTELRMAPGRQTEKVDAGKATHILREEGIPLPTRWTPKGVREAVEAKGGEMDREKGLGVGRALVLRTLRRLDMEGAFTRSEGKLDVRVVRKERR